MLGNDTLADEVEGEGETEGRGTGLSQGGRKQLPQFSLGWRGFSEHVFAVAKNVCFGG